MLVVFFVGFVSGIFAILGLGLVVVLVAVRLLNRRIQRRIKHETDAAAAAEARDPRHSLDSIGNNMQGIVWVLDPETVSSKEQKRKRDVSIEVSPVRKHARIQDQYLTLTGSDSSCIFVPLKGCAIQAVSATNLPSRKWAKRYPIKVESKSSLLNGSKIVYLYLETAWEKESWCKGLRLASCEDDGKLNWFTKLNVDFQAYMALLSAGYSSKPSLGFNAEAMDKGSKSDGSKSKVKSFWRKLSRKNSKVSEKKGNLSSLSDHEERKACENQHLLQDSVSNKAPNSSTEEIVAFTSPQGFPRSTSQSGASGAGAGASASGAGAGASASGAGASASASGAGAGVGATDGDSEHEKLNNDEGILCWNLLLSRIFFDIKASAELKSSLQTRIQRSLSNMRTPTYIGEVVCTNIDIGNLPPHIHAMRLLGNDMNELSAFEVDIEYCGGALIDVETRIEVRDQDFQKGIVDTNSESNSIENMSADLLEGFEHFGKHLNLNKEDFLDPKIDSGKGSKGRLKSVLNNIAKQVSQVPLTLSVRVVSLRGTMRLYIKPPPSDQLWYGFTAMPDLELVVESSVGDHKITNGHIALFLINRFKAAIRETMVLPNCESAYIPWMLAEKDDWIPRNVAPYIWLQEGCSDKREGLPPQVTESKASGNTSNCDLESKDLFHALPADSTPRLSTSSLPVFSSSPSYSSLHALATTSHPAATTDELPEARHCTLEATSSLPPPSSMSMREFVMHGEGSDDNNDRGPKMGRRAKLRDFIRKRMKMKSKDKDKGS
ncbi:hypothetical protein like AT1G17820 [Hibiscus trionum]|uniref:SMP-LTD domain-containing protein n=1 Tax=Hibiscus trionum TaxID=183268 RepID=A0A9W7MXE1_HIBTR|nr:hypothetical protein like AT1G17820 [Hibiscus trionum]